MIKTIDHAINIDLSKKINMNQTICIKENDNNSHKFLINILNNGLVYDLTGTTSRIYFLKKDGTKVFLNCTLDNALTGKISCLLTTQSLSYAGLVASEITIYGTAGEILTSVTFNFLVLSSVRDDAAIESTSEFTSLTTALLKVDDWDAQFQTKYDNLEAQYATDLTEVKTSQAEMSTQDLKAKEFRFIMNNPDELLLIGDSISEGYYSTSRQNLSYAGLIRSAFMTQYNTKNYGFENFNNEQTKLTKRTSMTFTEVSDASVYGGRIFNSTVLNQYLEVATICKDFKIVYKKNIGGAILNVLVDGVQIGTIDTAITPANNIDNACFSNAFILSSYGVHTIKLVNSETKPCSVMGIILLDDSTKNEPVFNNASISSIRLQDIPDNILEFYCKTKNIIFALGRNDQNGDMVAFESKVNYALNKIKLNNGKAIVCDFYFGHVEATAPCKRILREKAELYGFTYLDFQKYSYGTLVDNVNYGYCHADQIHPLDKGHLNIAKVILSELNIPFIQYKKPYGEWQKLELQGSWVNFGAGYAEAEYMLDKDNCVNLRGMIKNGATTGNIALLPVGFRPKLGQTLPVVANNLLGIVNITSSGYVNASAGISSSFTCLNGLRFGVD